MADTTTTVLAFVKQEVGAKRNTWGSSLNSTLDLIEEAICGRLSVSTTGGGTTLTQAQARKAFIDVSGALASDATITVPNASKSWIVTNSCTNDFGVLVKTSGGSATTVPPGTSKRITCDGNNVCSREDINEVGQLAFFGTSAVPSGWWEATGVTKSRAGVGLDLYNKAGTTWGTGNGVTTFTLPDGYTAGKFLRSRTASVAVGTAQSDQNKAHTHALTAASAAAGGSHTHTGTTDAGGSHTHTGTTDSGGVDHTHQYNYGSTVGSLASGGANSAQRPPDTAASSGTASAYLHTHTFTTGASSTHTHTFTTGASSTHTHTLSGTTDSDGGTEARPTNLSAILCIKY